MKRIWGLLLVGYCLLSGQDAFAERWLPYVEGVLQPRLLLLEYKDESFTQSCTHVDGFGGLGAQLEAGIHINTFDLYAAYMRNSASDEWHIYDYYDEMPGSEIETHIRIEGWTDQRVLLGFRHYPKATQYKGTHFLFGGALGFGWAQYDEHFYHVFGGRHEPYDSTDNRVFTSPVFLSFHFDLGVTISASKQVEVLLLFQTDQAEVDISGDQYKADLGDYIKVRIPKLHVGVRYLFGRR